MSRQPTCKCGGCVTCLKRAYVRDLRVKQAAGVKRRRYVVGGHLVARAAPGVAVTSASAPVTPRVVRDPLDGIGWRKVFAITPWDPALRMFTAAEACVASSALGGNRHTVSKPGY